MIPKDQTENTSPKIRPEDMINEETIDNTIACLIMSDDEAVNREHWLNTKTTGYRAQKATSTIRSKIAQVESFSNYLISPIGKGYKTFFESLMTTFKAIQCWLKMDISKRAPKGWSEKRLVIMNRISAMTRNSGESATLEELPIEPTITANSNSEYPKVSRKGRLELCQR